MKYDIFIVSAQADQAVIDVLVRRLRALKFKVRQDKARTHTTPTAKDIKDANAAETVLVAWSAAACNTNQADSDWVHAMAHQARSRGNAMVEFGLDRAQPDAPFGVEDDLSLAGLTARKAVPGLARLIERLEARTGRAGLNDWLALKSKDQAAKAIWITKYPRDPISQAANRSKPAPDKAAVRTAPARRPVVHQTEEPSQPLRSSDAGRDRLMVAAILAGILVMLISAYLVRRPAQNNAIGNAAPQFIFMCPNGERVMCPVETLEPTGPIIDDTE